MDRRRFLELGIGVASLPLITSCATSQALAISPGAGSAVAARRRLRDLGIIIGDLPPGPHNAITDVPGVAVGHTTLISGDGPLVKGEGPVRTGVTAILPHGRVLSHEPVFAADLTLNGNGELTGMGPLRRTGQLGAPILFTDTGSIGPVYDGAMGAMLQQDPALYANPLRPEPVVGETWADFLNDTAGRHVRAEHVQAALDTAASGPVAEGCVGGGTGMRAYQFKAGIGTASRLVSVRDGGKTYSVGVLVQANHGRRHQLSVNGVPVGKEITDLLPERGSAEVQPGNSLLVAIATDAPLLPIQLRRLCKRSPLGAARTGAISTHGSGDLLIAFSTAGIGASRPGDAADLSVLHFSKITGIFQAVVEATEEAILNSLTAAHTVIGRDGNTIHALPLDRLVDLMQKYGRLK
jgi:D-aminopeptidase